MTVAELTRVMISLDGACDFPSCSSFAFPLYNQLREGYEVCAVRPVADAPRTTARKRGARAERLGYRFAEIQREEYDEDIFEINTSLDERQGRPMSHGYRERQHFLPLPDYDCPRHAIRTYGVLSDRGQLVAYLWLYRSGDLALVSSILGHGEHLRNDVMYLLASGAFEAEIPYGGFLVYNRADSGTEGLRYFKAKLGFIPMEVAWEL